MTGSGKANGTGQGERDGTQLISRVANILRLLPLATGPGTGRRLSDIRVATGLSEATARRIMKALVREHMVVRDDGKRYRLGPLPLELGSISGYMDRFAERCRPHVRFLAQETGFTAVLSRRGGRDAVALIEEVGTRPINVRLIEIAARVPLGVTTGGTALMMNLSDEEIAEILQSPVYDGVQLRREELAERLRRGREAGYADISDVPIPGIRGIAVPVPSFSGHTTFALSLVTTKGQLEDGEIGGLVELLRKVGDRIAVELANC